MKVFEKINQLKGTTSTLEQIANWFYMNRIYPYDVVYNDALELGKDFPKGYLKDVLIFYDGKVITNGYDAVVDMLNEELKENKKC